jgi:F-type H+-transporting ATPase subunit gamma
MAKARAITKRRKAVLNIRKITRTMQLIASSRWPRAFKRAQASRPYAEKITEMVQTLAGQEIDHPLMRPNPHAAESLGLVITSNRGLCGAYNSSVLRTAWELHRRVTAGGGRMRVEMVGKKGVAYLRFLGITPAAAVTDIEDRIAYTRVAEMAERYMTLYSEGAISRVDVVYTRFVSVGVQRAGTIQLLPIEPPAVDETAQRGPRVDFEFSPPPAELLARLIPETVKIRLYQCFNESLVSEQVARMVAMKAATDAASEMIKFLTRSYNRARQSQITMELADIVGGAEAVK